MRQELDDLVCQRYPEIFRDRHADQTVTSMYWGFTCGDGWFGIIDDLCAQITSRVNTGQVPQVVATQVKSKMGCLRFGFVGQFDPEFNPLVRQLINLAASKSEQTCEACGAPNAAWKPDAVCTKCGAKR